MIELGQFEKNNLTICRHYRAVYNTPVIKEDPLKKKEVCSSQFQWLMQGPIQKFITEEKRFIKEKEGFSLKN